MNDLPHDFGTGLRAHLGLEESQLELVAEPEATPDAFAAEAAVGEATAEEAVATPDGATLDTLIAVEAELFERERALTLREATLAGRAGSLLAAAQALYDEVLGGGSSPHDDELGRLRRRKSVA